jgi:hypothetical protein
MENTTTNMQDAYNIDCPVNRQTGAVLITIKATKLRLDFEKIVSISDLK